ncbi:hypothetical protein DMC01_11650 [Campylobacter troglodytis]|nr:hypothetical protein DMC01_11650 [Campylobacter troglodytis]
MQNLLENASSLATYTRAMLENARLQNKNIALLGTRKTMPYAKKFLLKLFAETLCRIDMG